MQRPVFPLAIFLALAVTTGGSITAYSNGPERVSGYFCGAKTEQIAYLQRLSAGDTEEIAANVVNKAAGKQTCAYFLPANAIPAKDQTVMDKGVVFKVQSFVFLPEKVERWTGTYFGSLQPAHAKFSEL